MVNKTNSSADSNNTGENTNAKINVSDLEAAGPHYDLRDQRSQILAKHNYKASQKSAMIDIAPFFLQILAGVGASGIVSHFMKDFPELERAVASTTAGASMFSLSAAIVMIGINMWYKEKLRKNLNKELAAKNIGELNWDNLTEEDKKEVSDLIKINYSDILAMASKLLLVAGIGFGFFSFVNEHLIVDVANAASLTAKAIIVPTMTAFTFKGIGDGIGLPLPPTVIGALSTALPALVASAAPIVVNNIGVPVGRWICDLLGVEDEDSRKEFEGLAGTAITGATAALAYAATRIIYGTATMNSNLHRIENGEKPLSFGDRVKGTTASLWNTFSGICGRGHKGYHNMHATPDSLDDPNLSQTFEKIPKPS